MPITVSLPSRNVELEFPDSMTEQEIQAAIEQEYPRSGEDVAYEVEQAKTATIEGRDLVNPFEGMSNDDYALFRKHLAEKKTSLGDALGIAADTFGTIVSEVGKAAGATGEAVLGGEFGAAGESAVEGMVAGTVGLADIADKIFQPARTIPSKEEFLKRKIETGKPAGMVRGDFGVEEVAIPSFRPATEADYAALIEQEKQRDAEATNRLYAMEATLRGAPIEEVARGFQYVDPTLLASLGGTAAAKLAGKTLFKGAARTAATQAATTARTAPGAIGQAALAGVERAAGAVESVAGLPSRAITAVGNIAENIAPGTGLPTRGAAVATTMMGGAGIPLAGAAATEKAAEVVGSVARAARQEASRAGLLERAAMDAGISPAARKVAAGLAQIQPGISAVGRLTAQAAKEGAAGAVVGSGLGYLAEGNLEGAAAGAGAGAAIGGLSGTLRSSFDLGREMLGKSTSRTREQATGDLNRFLGERPEVEQAAWGDTINRLVQQVGPERAASQVDAMRIAEANGARVRVATPDEMKQWQNPGWLNVDGMEVVLNPSRILGDTASHETAHVLFSSVINRAFRPEIETAIFGLADPVNGEIVRPGLFDDADLAKVADQIGDSYGTNTQAANEFRGYANVLRNSTDSTSLQNARTSIADEMTAAYTGRLFNRIRPGRFNPDRLPLAYRKALNALEDGILDKFRSVLFEKGMDLGFNNITKTFTNEKGKPIRIPELDAIVKRAMAKKGTKEAAAPTAKPDLIPAKPADRVIWARSYGGARGILNDDGTPKSEAQVNAEAAARWQDMTQRMAALPENERIGIEFSRDKTGKTVMTAKGQISPTAINAILDSGALDPSAKAVLRDVLVAMQDPNKSTFDTSYYGVYTRGRGGNRMVAGVKSASQNEILPYSVEMNSKDGVIIRAVDMTKVRERLETAMNKPQFKSLYGSPADALKDFNRYLENITQVNPVESAMLLGGGEKGAKKRNLFYDALGFRLRNGESLVNAPESVISKSQNTIKSYRVERFAKLQKTGFAFPFEEATTYERAMRNFQPDAFTRETLPNGEAMTNPDGYRILKKTGSSLFRVYDDKGELIGVAKNELGAMRMAQRKFIDGWHGSPHNFMRFMTQKIGTGEGVQAFGYGLYIAENKVVAEGYKTVLSARDNNLLLDGSPIEKKTTSAERESASDKAIAQAFYAPLLSGKTKEDARAFLLSMSKDEKWSNALREFDTSRLSFEKDNTGSLYRVQLNVLPEQLLDWDKPLSEQPEKVQQVFFDLLSDLTGKIKAEMESKELSHQEKAVALGLPRTPINIQNMIDLWLNNATASGAGLYDLIRGLRGKGTTPTDTAKAASEYLASLGIPGIRYLDQGSRATGEGTSNYVIFDDGLIRILDRNGKPVGKRLFRDVAEEGYNVRFQPDDTAKKTTKEEKQTGFQPSEFRFQPDDPNNTADAKAAQNTLKTTYFKNQEEFQKAVAEGRVRKANIEDFIGKVVALHQPDNAMVGTVEFNGTTVVVGEGGVYYAVKFGKDGSLWASTKTAAEKTAKALNEIHDANNGKIYMGLTSAPVTKLFSSTNMATGIVDTLAEVSKLSKYGMTESALNGIITKASKVPFVKKKNGEIVSESRLKVNLDEKNSLNENLSLLREVLKPENSSFDNRTTFSGAIANNLAVFFKDKPKESAKFASLILGDSNKYAKASIRKGKLSKDAILQAFGDMFSEGFLKDFQSAKGSGHLYAVLEMDGRVESVHSPNHKSYPFTVKSTSGKKPVVHILDKAMPWQDVVGLAGQEGYVPKELKKSVYPSSGFSTTKHGHLEVRKPREGAVPTLTNIMFQPDPASPNILNGSNGTRIIKSPSGKFRIYSVTGTLLGIRESEQAAQKLATK